MLSLVVLHLFQPRRTGRPAASPHTKPFRINASTNTRICIKTNDFNRFRIRTYTPSLLAHKTKDFNPNRINTYAIVHRKAFIINTSKKGGGGGVGQISLNPGSPLRATRHELGARAVRLYTESIFAG